LNEVFYVVKSTSVCCCVVDVSQKSSSNLFPI